MCPDILVFDRCLGWKVPKHLERLTGITCITREDIVRDLNHNPEWKVSDTKYIDYAEQHDSILVTADYNLFKRAMKRNVPTIYMTSDGLEFWSRIFRVLAKIGHPLANLYRFIDLRLTWGYTRKWKIPKKRSKKDALGDKTYLLR